MGLGSQSDKSWNVRVTRPREYTESQPGHSCLKLFVEPYITLSLCHQKSKYYHRTGHGAGVTPVDTEREHLTTSHATSTNHGPHTTNTANKLDPRFDSDVDHRANPDGTIR